MECVYSMRLVARIELSEKTDSTQNGWLLGIDKGSWADVDIVVIVYVMMEDPDIRSNGRGWSPNLSLLENRNRSINEVNPTPK